MRCFSTAFMATLLLAAPLRAQEPAAPTIITDGLHALVASGIDSAITTWFKGSSLAGDTAVAGTVVRAFANVPDYFGKPTGFEVLKTYALGSHLRRTYALVLFDRSPVYVRFQFYLGSAGWVIQHFDFNTDPEKVLPTSLALP